MRWFSNSRTSFLESGVGGGFVGDLLEGRKKAETSLIRGGGGGGGGGVHRCTFLTFQGRYRLKKVETTIKPLLLGKTLLWNLAESFL